MVIAVHTTIIADYVVNIFSVFFTIFVIKFMMMHYTKPAIIRARMPSLLS